MAATSLAALVEVLAGKTLAGLSVKTHRLTQASADGSDTVEITVVLRLPFSMAGARRQHRQQLAAAQEAREAAQLQKQHAEVSKSTTALAVSTVPDTTLATAKAWANNPWADDLFTAEPAGTAAAGAANSITTAATLVQLQFDASNPFASAILADET